MLVELSMKTLPVSAIVIMKLHHQTDLQNTLEHLRTSVPPLTAKR